MSRPIISTPISTRTKGGVLAKSASVGLGAALALALVGAAPSASGASTGPASLAATGASNSALCHYTWGSLPESNPTMATGPLTNVRSGRHACYDRLVIDLRGKASGYSVRYVGALTQPGSGGTVAVRGGARLQVTINAPAYDSAGRPTYAPKNPSEIVNVTGYSAFRQVVWLGSYEGYSDLGIGVRARTTFRVFTMSDATTSRVVIDVAHNW